MITIRKTCLNTYIVAALLVPGLHASTQESPTHDFCEKDDTTFVEFVKQAAALATMASCIYLVTKGFQWLTRDITSPANVAIVVPQDTSNQITVPVSDFAPKIAVIEVPKSRVVTKKHSWWWPFRQPGDSYVDNITLKTAL